MSIKSQHYDSAWAHHAARTGTTHQEAVALAMSQGGLPTADMAGHEVPVIMEDGAVAIVTTRATLATMMRNGWVGKYRKRQGRIVWRLKPAGEAVVRTLQGG